MNGLSLSSYMNLNLNLHLTPCSSDTLMPSGFDREQDSLKFSGQLTGEHQVTQLS